VVPLPSLVNAATQRMADGAGAAAPSAGAVHAENHVLRAANCDLAVSNARLRAELAEAREALRRAAPARSAPPRSRAAFQELPVEVLALVFGFLESADVFAAARTCRSAREASRTRGAFLRVDLGALDDQLAATRGLLVPQDGPPSLPPGRSASAASFLAFLASCDAAAGVRTLILRRGVACNASAEGVAALVSRCTALDTLVIDCPRGVGWPPEAVDAILRAAAATTIPVRHVDAPLVGSPLDALVQLAHLETLTLRRESGDLTRLPPPSHFEVQPALDVVQRLLKLHTLVVRAPCSDTRSETDKLALCSLKLQTLDVEDAAGFPLTHVDCPRLTNVRYCVNSRRNDASTLEGLAVALMRGCPLIQWRMRTSRVERVWNDARVRECTMTVLNLRVELAVAFGPNDPQTLLLIDDTDAARFMYSFSHRGVIVDGKLVDE
jgi:hypothetical protein